MKLLARWSAAAAAALTIPADAAAANAHLTARARAAGARRSPPHGEAAGTLPPDDDALPRGCGWFESSHELGLGLQVTEHAHPDQAASALPLDLWLAWHLAGFHADASAIVARAPVARAGPH